MFYVKKKIYLCTRSLRSLSEGKHEFNYQIDNKFFQLLNDDTADVKKGNLNVVVFLKKTSTTFELNFDIQGQTFVPCDRCLDEMVMEVNTKNRLVVKFGKEYSEESDEIVIIPEEDGEINIAWFLYEFIVLSLPMKKVHPTGECNKTMASKLKKHKATSDDEEDDDSDIDEEEDDSSFSDSRWDALKDIQIDDN